MLKEIRILFSTALLLTVLSLLINQNVILARTKVDKIDEIMELYHKLGQFNGTVLVAEHGKVIYKKGFGLANMEWNIPNELDTKFLLASITKQFTSMLIMQLVEEGKLRLHGKITDYLPYYRKDTGDKITIHNLLNHTHGITDPNWNEIPLSKYYPIDEFVRNFLSNDLEFEPGTNYHYGIGHIIAVAIIEKITGKTYEEVLKEKIFDPLNMKNSGFAHHNTIIKKQSHNYVKILKGFENAPYRNTSQYIGASGMYSTVEDLYLWDQALYTDKLLSQKYKDLMFIPYLNNYGYGWRIDKLILEGRKDTLKVISHGGGGRCLIFRIIDDHHLIVLLSNIRNRTSDINREIINILYDKPYNLPKKLISETLLNTIQEKDIETAIKQYYELKTNNPQDYNFNENELNALGYQLLGIQKVKEAIEIFKLNVEAYQKASNTYDSLGEAYMINGDKELAIKNYKKSLELNPDNANAILMLKKLEEPK